MLSQHVEENCPESHLDMQQTLIKKESKTKHKKKTLCYMSLRFCFFFFFLVLMCVYLSVSWGYYV